MVLQKTPLRSSIESCRYSNDVDFRDLDHFMDKDASYTREEMKDSFRRLRQTLPNQNLKDPLDIIRSTQDYINFLKNSQASSLQDFKDLRASKFNSRH